MDFNVVFKQKHWHELRGGPPLYLFLILLAGGTTLAYTTWQTAPAAAGDVAPAVNLIQLSGITGVLIAAGSLIYLLTGGLKKFTTLRRCRNDVRRALVLLQDELEGLQRFVADVDSRTRDYFHCVTNSKVTVYYHLYQIRQELERAVGEVEALYRLGSAHDLAAAKTKFLGPFTYFEAFMADTGTTKTIPFPDVPTHIGALCIRLAESIAELEEDLRGWRKEGDPVTSTDGGWK